MVRGVELLAAESLHMSIYVGHHDRQLRDDPEAFRLERWANSASRADDSYFPFGSGPRVCIARQVAPAVTFRPSHPVRARVTEH
mgnify:CR=1 FL=1